MFRCECCPKAYCEDCLPAEAVVQGESRRINALGYRMPGNACYILCSLDCINYFETEVEPPNAAAVAAPHQLQIVKQYQHEAPEPTAAPDGAVEQAGEGLQRSTSTVMLNSPSALPPAVTTSLEHALNNCALDDIRDRLGYDRTAADGDSDAPTTAVAYAAAAAAARAALNTRLSVRFENLGEIPNFHLRLQKASSRIKSLLFKLVRDIERFQSFIRRTTATTVAEELSSTGGAAAGEKETEHELSADESAEDTHLSVEKIQHSIFHHAGVAADLPIDIITRVFLHTVSSVAKASKHELFPVAEVLGLSFVTPIVRYPKSAASMDPTESKFLNEPKFRCENMIK